MTNVAIIQVSDFHDFAYIIYPTSFVNPLLKKKMLNERLEKTIKEPCHILFDLLLCNGNEFNRFCEVEFDGEKLLLDTIRLLENMSSDDINFVEQYYTQNKGLLTRSVLTPKEYLRHC